MARFAAASVAHLIPCLVLFFGVTRGNEAWLVSGADKYSCSQPGMICSFNSSNCLDPAWARSHRYTPSGPDRLDLMVSTRRDLNGNLLPVINASWTLKDDGSISFLKASELNVLVVSTNQNICVRYSFSNELEMTSKTGHKWKLTSDVLVVDPGQSYRVSVENIPKPEINHSASSISRSLHVPDCSDPEMRNTQPCIDSGAQWRPDILLSHSGGKVLTVDFSPHPVSEMYMVLCRCDHRDLTVTKTLITNGSRLSASFPLDQWDRTCCRFHVQIKPFFRGCGNDCRRHRSSLDLCSSRPPSCSSLWL